MDQENKCRDISANEYQKKSLRTAPKDYSPKKLLINGVMGLAGEAGECVDMVKKHVFQGHDLDRDKLIKELGDVSWYVAITARALGIPLGEVFCTNIDKLTARYPDGFSAEKSINRAEGDV